MTRLPVGTEIEAVHPPHGGRWERLPDGKLRLIGATYPQTETPAEAARRAALAMAPDHVLRETPIETAARAALEAEAPVARAAKKKES